MSGGRTCKEVLDFLMAYLDGELPPAERATFDQHLAHCPPCVHYLANYRVTVRLCRKVGADTPNPTPPLPEDLVQAILNARRGGGAG